MKYGYTIKWEHIAKTVSLVKGEKTLCFVVGEAKWHKGAEENILDEVIKLIDEKVYVPLAVEQYL